MAAVSEHKRPAVRQPRLGISFHHRAHGGHMQRPKRPRREESLRVRWDVVEAIRQSAEALSMARLYASFGREQRKGPDGLGLVERIRQHVRLNPGFVVRHCEILRAGKHR